MSRLWCVLTADSRLHSVWADRDQAKAERSAAGLDGGCVLSALWPLFARPNWSQLEAMLLSHEGAVL